MTAPTMNRRWSSAESQDLYNIRGWGNGVYVSVGGYRPYGWGGSFGYRRAVYGGGFYGGYPYYGGGGFPAYTVASYGVPAYSTGVTTVGYTSGYGGGWNYGAGNYVNCIY